MMSANKRTPRAPVGKRTSPRTPKLPSKSMAATAKMGAIKKVSTGAPSHPSMRGK